MHRVDGSSFYCNTKERKREQGWKAQGILLTYTEYKEILEKQEYRCALCGRHETKEGRSLSVDHDHKTGKIRGVICRGCNSAVGWIEREMNLSLEELLEYVEGDKEDSLCREYEFDVLP